MQTVVIIGQFEMFHHHHNMGLIDIQVLKLEVACHKRDLSSKAVSLWKVWNKYTRNAFLLLDFHKFLSSGKWDKLGVTNQAHLGSTMLTKTISLQIISRHCYSFPDLKLLHKKWCFSCSTLKYKSMNASSQTPANSTASIKDS